MADIPEFEFGDRVKLAATVRPVYIEATKRQVTRRPNQINTINHDGPLRVVSADYSDDEARCGTEDVPGEPRPDAWPLPTKSGKYRHIRRFPGEREGVVVGKTWRSEGQRFAEDYDQPAYLVEHGRVDVYQVAVDPGDYGGRVWPKATVLALPDDLEAQT